MAVKPTTYIPWLPIDRAANVHLLVAVKVMVFLTS